MTKPAASFCTIVDDVTLRSAIRVWMYTPVPALHMIRGPGQDLYLMLVAHAVGLPYGEVMARYGKNDPGIQAARRKTKRIIFQKLMNDPASILQVHDEVVVHEPAAVESRS